MTRSAYQLQKLIFAYGKETVLAIDHLHIEAGHITALIGPNGAGKSTLFQLLAFLRSAQTGEIAFFGDPVQTLALPQLCQQVALVQQNPYLLKGTVRANIELGLRLRRLPAEERVQRTDAVLSQLSLQPLAARKVNRLSGGETQKVAIARALVLQPKVLLLDEPFTHLDRGFHSMLEALLRELPEHNQCTVVFSSHDLHRAQSLADTVFSLVKGNAVKSSLVNLFRGEIHPQDGYFDSGRIQIMLADKSHQGNHLAIEPAHIVLSGTRLDSSIRNSYAGRISALSQDNGQVRVSVEAGEHFEVMITHAALLAQGYGLGQEVWLSFKSTSVRVF